MNDRLFLALNDLLARHARAAAAELLRLLAHEGRSCGCESVPVAVLDQLAEDLELSGRADATGLRQALAGLDEEIP